MKKIEIIFHFDKSKSEMQLQLARDIIASAGQIIELLNRPKEIRKDPQERGVAPAGTIHEKKPELVRVQGKGMSKQNTPDTPEKPIVVGGGEPKKKRTFKEKICEGCGITFLPTHNKQRFCKKECNPNVAKKTSVDPVPEKSPITGKHTDPDVLKEKLDKLKHDYPVKRERPNITRDFSL